MIEHDAQAIGTLLSSKGVVFTELYARDNMLVIGIPDGPYITLETVSYVWGVVDALSLDCAFIKFRGGYLLVEK